MMSSVGVEDTEKIGLLKKIADSSQLVTGRSSDMNLLDEKSAKIKCSRCGFINAQTSTVCKECNSLLKDAEFFLHKKEQQYY